MTSARQQATEYLDVETDPARREEIFAKLAAEIEVIKGLPEKYRARIRQEEKLVALFVRAHDEHQRARADAGTDRTGASTVARPTAQRADLPGR